jgi:hypothetical protein
VEFKFKERIDPVVFHKHFSGLNKLDFSLSDNAIFINKEGMARFSSIMKKNFKLLEMNLNHKKYEGVLTHLLDNQIESIEQINPDTAILIRFKTKVDSDLFNKHFTLEKSNFDVTEDELIIFPDGITDFNKEIDFIYVDVAQNSLIKQNAKSFTFTKF